MEKKYYVREREETTKRGKRGSVWFLCLMAYQPL